MKKYRYKDNQIQHTHTHTHTHKPVRITQRFNQILTYSCLWSSLQRWRWSQPGDDWLSPHCNTTVSFQSHIIKISSQISSALSAFFQQPPLCWGFDWSQSYWGRVDLYECFKTFTVFRAHLHLLHYQKDRKSHFTTLRGLWECWMCAVCWGNFTLTECVKESSAAEWSTADSYTDCGFWGFFFSPATPTFTTWRTVTKENKPYCFFLHCLACSMVKPDRLMNPSAFSACRDEKKNTRQQSVQNLKSVQIIDLCLFY